METHTMNVHILVVSSDGENRSYYEKILTGIKSIKNNMPTSSTLTYEEYKLGHTSHVEKYVDEAQIVLLLLSHRFTGSDFYRKEVEIILQRCNKNGTRVIPVQLSSSAFEHSPLLKGLHPLPSDKRPISQWISPDEGVNNVVNGIRRVSYHILNELGCKVEELEEQDDNAEQDGQQNSATAFNWTDTIAPLSYLTYSAQTQEAKISRLQRLRTIMRTLYERQKIPSTDKPLDEQEIYEIVNPKLDDGYTFQECKADLKYLAQSSNLVRLDDMNSMARSIPTFESLLNKKSYRITSDGKEIERLIEARMHSNKGRLSKSDLDRVKQLLFEINAYLEKVEIKPDDQDEMADKWNSALRDWENIVREATDFFSAMERNAQYHQHSFDKYMQYKDVVITYVQNYADIFLKISHEINEIFVNWSSRKDLLIYNIAQAEKRKPSLEEDQSFEETAETIRRQVTDLEVWFKEGAHVFYARAASEIHRVVDRAISIARYQRSRIDSVEELTCLAMHILRIRNIELSQQIFDAAFAHALPLHLSEDTAGLVQVDVRPQDMLSVWDEAPPMSFPLAPTKQRNTVSTTQKSEGSINDNNASIYSLYEQELQKEVEFQQRFIHLFAQGSIDLRSIGLLQPEDRDMLEDIIDACLNHPNHQYLDQTGIQVLLLNPCEQDFTSLEASDGILFLPCYRLKLQDAQHNEGDLLLVGDTYAH